MRRILFYILLLLLPFTGHSKQSENLNCSQLLAKSKASYKPVDFRFSEIQARYIELLKMSVRFSDHFEDQSFKPNQEFYDFGALYMKKKTSLLNDILTQVWRIKKLKSERKGTRTKMLFAMADFIVSLGYQPEQFGISKVKGTEGADAVYFVEASKSPPPSTEDSSTPNKIGFYIPSSDNTTDNRSSRQRHTIGFGPQQPVIDNEKPDYFPNTIDFEPVKNSERILFHNLKDEETYSVNYKILSIKAFTTAEFVMQINFDQREHEWIISFKNLTNPDNRIGFDFGVLDSKNPD